MPQVADRREAEIEGGRWTRVAFKRMKESKRCNRCPNVLVKGKYALRETTYYGRWESSYTIYRCAKGCVPSYYEPGTGHFQTQGQRNRSKTRNPEKSPDAIQ